MTALTRPARDRLNASPVRTPASVTLPETLIQDAKALDVDLSQACEAGLKAAVSAALEAAWLRENRDAIEAWNEYVEKHGIPLEEFRQF